MKIKIIAITLLAAVSVLSEELTELQKIDQRLEELKTVWRQDAAIINQLTNFKRTPVQEGTQAYYKCLEASKRIQQAEAEAKDLKEKRNQIIKSASSNSLPNSVTTEKKFQIRNFDVAAVKSKSALMKDKTLVFKGFYLGMNAGDALGLINDYMSLPQCSDNIVNITDEELQKSGMEKLRKGFEGEVNKNPFEIVKSNDAIVIVVRPDFDDVFAIIDKDMKVESFRFSNNIRNVLFDSSDAPLDEFTSTFSKAYELPPLEKGMLTIKSLTSDVGAQKFWSLRSEKGYELIVWGEKTFYAEMTADNMFMTRGQGGAEGSIFLKKIQTKEQRDKKFD